MKKTLSILLALVLVLALATVAMADVQPPKRPVRVAFGTGSTGGNFYLVGGGMAGVMNNLLPEFFSVTAEETGGSSANLQMIENGEIDLGISMTSTIAEAVAGTAKWSNGKPSENIRGLVPLYPSYMTVYTLANSGITCWSDFAGKIIGTGSSGAAMDSYMRKAFVDLGIEVKDIFNDGHGATATALSDENIDAAILFSLPPFAAIAELEATKELRFIGLTEEEQAYFTQYPFYSAATMPAGSYKGNADYDVPTISEWNMLCVSKEMDADYVYVLAKTFFENNPDLVAIHHSLSYVLTENAQFFNCPLHVGVIRYLEEVGVTVPESLIPAEYTK